MSRATVSTVSMLLLALVLQPPDTGAQSSPKCVVPPELVVSRPGPSETPTEITAGLFLIDLRSIDDSKQSFDADVAMNLSWRDPRLDLEELAGCRVSLDAVWNPRHRWKRRLVILFQFAQKPSALFGRPVAIGQRRVDNSLHIRPSKTH